MRVRIAVALGLREKQHRGYRSNPAVGCWGGNEDGQLGDGTQIDRIAPVSGGLSFSKLSIGSRSTCGLAGEEIWCWGHGYNYKLGTGRQDNEETPQKVEEDFAYSEVSVGQGFVVAIGK